MRDKKTTFSIAAVLLVILVTMSFLDTSMVEIRIEKNLTKIDYENPIKQIALELLTGFREILARIIWEKIHRYFHRYEFFEKAGVLSFNVKDPEKATYKQTNILPWIRMSTWLDPNFYEPYLVGAWHLANNLGKYEEAKKLMNEVEKNNPDDPILKYELANNYFMMREYEKAANYCQLALKTGELPGFETLDAMRLIKLAYKNIGKSDKTVDVGHKIVKEIVQKKGDTPITRYKIANIYFAIDELEKSLQYNRAALRSEELNEEQMIHTLKIMRISYHRLGKTEEADEIKKILEEVGEETH